jgi:hypothetical protein
VIDNIFDGLPNEFATEELCLAVVQKNGYMLRFVPEALKTEVVCIIAVKQDEYAFQYVSKKLQSKAKAALKGNGA